ncbi:MAG: Fic family protein [Planctomycetes bacterium]|nr:Fic family protein [Planctomycetota bacterium]
MRIPTRPPDFSELLKEATDPGRFQEILSSTQTQGTSKYLHWDKLRHLQPPEGLSHREWWLALKLTRGLQAKLTPLKDPAGTAFPYVLVDPIPERLHDIDLRAGGSIEMDEPITNPDTKDRYLVRSLIGEAITSSQLEGAATTRQVAKEMIRTGRAPSDRSERMILNNYLTMQRIGKLRNEPLTTERILEVHRLVTKDALDNPDGAGRFRQSHEKIDVGDDYGQVFHNPPPAEQLDERMAAMCDFANGKTPAHFVHPVIRAIILHFWLAYDHPFVDGNGRTARALFYWSMLHSEYWLCEFISISEIILQAPVQYARAFLYTETDGNDLTYFILYHLEVIRRAIDQLHEYVQRKTKELAALERELRGLIQFNHRQRDLISHALRHPHHRYTIEGHRSSHNVVYQTARTDLLDLADRGLFDAKKVRREWWFTPTPDLEEKLRAP